MIGFGLGVILISSSWLIFVSPIAFMSIMSGVQIYLVGSGVVTNWPDIQKTIYSYPLLKSAYYLLGASLGVLMCCSVLNFIMPNSFALCFDNPITIVLTGINFPAELQSFNSQALIGLPLDINTDEILAGLLASVFVMSIYLTLSSMCLSAYSLHIHSKKEKEIHNVDNNKK